MIVVFIFLLVGFTLLIKGADWFVDGASNLALILKVPALVVGLTIVAFGTSAPEASVSVQAALNGSADIAISNIVGSNMFNLLACIGACSAFAALQVPKSIIKRDIPFLLVVSVVIIPIIYTNNQISRVEAMFLLLCIIGYVSYMVYSVSKNKVVEKEEHLLSKGKSFIYIIIGLLGIFIGGDLVVDSATKIALNFGLSETLVGLTIVSIGTSLPELVTSFIATKKGQTDIAVGNVIGSNLFNILFILGLSGSIVPISVNNELIIDSILVLLVTILIYIMALKNTISRKSGFTLVALFVLYTIYIVLRG